MPLPPLRSKDQGSGDMLEHTDFYGNKRYYSTKEDGPYYPDYREIHPILRTDKRGLKDELNVMEEREIVSRDLLYWSDTRWTTTRKK